MAEDWSDIEVELMVADYFAMLTDEIQGIKYNKSEHRRTLLEILKNRTESSIEFKHRNISAVLVEMDLPYIKGYIPLYNFQRGKLIAEVTRYLSEKNTLEKSFDDFSKDSRKSVHLPDLKSFIVSAPKKRLKKEEFKIERRPIKTNYLEREQNNRGLGSGGEELALYYERALLINSGKQSLADKVEWVSKDIGDGLGYDILSKNINGSDKYIEVKTTKLGKEAPFFFSSNEYSFSAEKKAAYYLYRIFDFNDAPKMFILQGSFDEFCRVEAVQYKGMF